MSEGKVLTDEELLTRFTAHQVSAGRAEALKDLRKAGFVLASIINELCPKSAEAMRAINKVEEAIFLASASVARYGAQMAPAAPEG